MGLSTSEDILQFLRADDLPQSVRGLTDRIGLAATMKLIQEYGGTRLYLPDKLPPEHKLVRLVGLSAARVITGHFIDGQPTIPAASYAIRCARDRAILAASGSVSVRRLARIYNLSERQIHNIRSGDKNRFASRPAATYGHSISKEGARRT